MRCVYAQKLDDAASIDPQHLGPRAAATMFDIRHQRISEHRKGKCVCTVPAVKQPEQLLTGKVDRTPDGGEFIDVQTTEPVTDWADVFARFNVDPDLYEIIGDTVRMSTWQQSRRTDDGDRDIINLHSYRASFRRKITEESFDLPALYAQTASPTTWPPLAKTGRCTVVVWADPQIGKTGKRGGTPELIERSERIRHQLEHLLDERQPERVLIADAGDGIEGFESGGNPMFTNDLSLAGQMDLYGSELFRFIDTCHRFAPVTVAGVPSNHAAWRNGKQNLGTPGDDLGLFMHKQTQRVTDAALMDVRWVKPGDYDESVAVDLNGTTIGVVHGNQFGNGQAINWWEKQTFGAQAVSRADVLVTGHYHCFGAGVAGRNPVTQRQRWWLGAPTLDNGSDWYRQTAGRDSDPGLLVFDVTDDGFDLASLTILDGNTIAAPQAA